MDTNIEKDDIVSVALAAAKGVIGSIPFAGSFISEFISLAQDKIADKRLTEWKKIVDNKFSALENKMEALTENEFFYSCVLVATNCALKAHQTKKREYFANALYNSVDSAGLLAEKKLIFFSLLDRYTLLSIKLLDYYSKDRTERNNFQEDQNNMVRTYTWGGTEKPIKGIEQFIPELSNEYELIKTISTQLISDGLIEHIDFSMPVPTEDARKKRTSQLGDEFINFITE